MIATKTDRWFFRCTYGCKKSWAIDLDATAKMSIETIQGFYSRHTACPHCGHIPQDHPRCKGYILGHKIMGKVYGSHLVTVTLAPPCDGRCTNAQGPSCDCLCGGANHGSKKLVEVLKQVA